MMMIVRFGPARTETERDSGHVSIAMSVSSLPSQSTPHLPYSNHHSSFVEAYVIDHLFYICPSFGQQHGQRAWGPFDLWQARRVPHSHDGKHARNIDLKLND